MPTYTYRCNKCGEEIEAFQSMSDAPLKRCKQCRGALRRTFHPVGIVLKGSGFHRNDYRSTSSKRSESGSRSSDDTSSRDKGSGGDKSSGSTSSEGAAKTSGGGSGSTSSTDD